MNYFDLVMIAIVLSSSFIGAYRGFFRESLSSLAWVFSLWLSWNFYPVFIEVLEPYLLASLVTPASISLFFFISLAFCTLVARLIERLFSFTGLRVINRPLGVAFGAMRGVVILVIVINIIFSSPINKYSWFRKSLTYQYCHDYSILNKCSL